MIKSLDTRAKQQLLVLHKHLIQPLLYHLIFLMKTNGQMANKKLWNDHLSEVCLAQIWCICLEHRQQGVSNDCTCEPDMCSKRSHD